MFTSRLASLLEIPPSDQRRTWLLFLYAFGMSGAYVAARTDADALFLSRAGIERLPAMILVSATAVTLLTAVYARIVTRLALQRVILGFHLCLAVATLLLARRLQAPVEGVAIPALLYLLAEFRGALGTIHFSTLLNELFSQSIPSRVAGVAGAGSTLAGVLLGGATGVLASRLGVSGLLYLIPVFDLFSGVIAVCSRGDAGAESSGLPTAAERDTSRAARRLRTRRLLTHPLARYVWVSVALKTIVVLLLEYEWKLLAVKEYSNEADLAAFFGHFYAVLFLLTGLVQLLGTSRVLTGLGIRAALASFPACVLVVLLLFGVAGGHSVAFWGLTLARGCDVLRRSLTDAAIQVLYWPLDSAFRKQVIAFAGGSVKPIVEALTAALLIPLALHLPRAGLSLVIVGLCAVWLVVIYRSSAGTRSRRSGRRTGGNGSSGARTESQPPAR